MCTTLLWRKNTAVGLRDDWLRRSCHPIIAKLPKIGAKISIALRINQSTSPCLLEPWQLQLRCLCVGCELGSQAGSVEDAALCRVFRPVEA